MKRPMLVLCLSLLAGLPLCAQTDPSPSPATGGDRPLQERIAQLERDLETYQANYARLEELFLRTVALSERLLDEGSELAAGVDEFLAETRGLRNEIDRTLAESKAVIDYLKHKVAVRPTALLEAELSWHILLGGELGLSFVWEPLPWLALRAGAELWYTDAFRPAFPLSVRLRLGLD
jgi:hypothetical protein